MISSIGVLFSQEYVLKKELQPVEMPGEEDGGNCQSRNVADSQKQRAVEPLSCIS